MVCSCIVVSEISGGPQFTSGALRPRTPPSGKILTHPQVLLSKSKKNNIFTEIWLFNDFQNGGRPPSWILASWCKILLISEDWLMSYGQKSDFQDGGRRHLEF